MSEQTLDVVISFDTTGSMYGYLKQVRAGADALVRRLFDEIPGLRMGVMAHGDYCDEKTSYLLRKVDLTDDKKALLEFIKKVPGTGGGDAPEAYEHVLHESRALAWREGGARVLVLIGDAMPHEPSYAQNKAHLDWHAELGALADAGVKIYGVQAGRDATAKTFYSELSERTGGTYLTLTQLKHISDMILGIAMRERGEEHLSRYAVEVARARRMDSGLGDAFRAMLGRELTEAEATGRDGVASDPGAPAAPRRAVAKRVARKAAKPAKRAAARKPARAKKTSAAKRAALARQLKKLRTRLETRLRARRELAARTRATTSRASRIARRLASVKKTARKLQARVRVAVAEEMRVGRAVARLRAQLAKASKA